MLSEKREQTSRNQEGISICSQLNLNIQKLQDQNLLSNPIYRRLVNIVKNDMSRGDLSFRKNLIKELYFLLQITPVIRLELRDKFLIEVEKMYNLNDHKKIDLASNKLNNMLSRFSNKKDTTISGPERPKSGVTWNQDVVPFLRPYTATRPKSTKQGKGNRPESSKYNSQSTKVDTLDGLCIRQFTTNIQEELEISRDFIERHRTNHPDYEPVYEQLYQILKKIENKEQEEIQKPKAQPKSLKYPRSAITRHKEQSWVRPEENRQSEQLIPLNDGQIESENDEGKETPREQGESEHENSQQEQYLYVNQQKKEYKPFSRTIKIQQKNQEYTVHDQSLKKYSHLMNTKAVHALREDQEMAKKYLNYARTKSALKRQINRRNESRRLMSAKQTSTSAIKFTKVSTQKQNLDNSAQGLIVDLTKDPRNLDVDPINTHPTYNRKQALKQLYQQPIGKFKTRNNVGYVHSITQKPQIIKRPMTSYTRFHSPVRFDPLSLQNVRQHNADVLEEVQKIKMKLGGKCYASTENLMKALVVFEPEDFAPVQWTNKSPFYNMLSMGPAKKLKKKTRRNLKTGNPATGRR